ncbi:MAG: S1 RNA-binding domain-containing protein, partial [Halobacteriovoraceae bacterium]|nr:S1 RNA-binding domain-containing protein [Halobacteriovoraceae bacterium]
KEKYLIGEKVEGEIVSVKDYGIFVELDDGIEGLVHVSEISWTGKIKNPIKHYYVGNRLEAQVLNVDVENKRISLGIKQLTANPWDKIAESYNIGQVVKGKIKSIVEFGVFIDLGEEVDALIHVSDFSWVRKNINLAKEYKVGQEMEAMVLSIDKEDRKFCLGIKQLEEDPWKRIEERIPVGSLLEAEVVQITDFGVFMKLETGIEGLVHVSELSEEHVENPADLYKKGDRAQAVVISVNKEAKKISLSIKAVAQAEGQKTLDLTQKEVNPATLADKLKKFTLNKEEEDDDKNN